MTAIGHEARAAAVLENLRRRNERVEVHRDHGDINRLSAELDTIKAIIADLPKALVSLSGRIAQLEDAAAAAGDMSSSVLQLSVQINDLGARLKTIETGWLPFEDTMRQHANKRSA